MPDSAPKTCEGCGAEITADQIIHRQAGLVGGILLCPKCVAQKRRELVESRMAAVHSQESSSPSISTASQTSAPGASPISAQDESQGEVWIPPIKTGFDEADESIALISDEETSGGHTTEIKSFATGSTLAGAHDESKFKRPLAGPNEPATRCRTFHGKLTQPGLAHMDDQINEWLDDHPEIFIKNTASTVGVFESKTKEPHLLVTMFY